MPQPADIAPVPPQRQWLVRIPGVFEGVADEVLRRFGAASSVRLGPDYYLIDVAGVDAMFLSEAAKFVQWKLPVDYSWLCDSQSVPRFIESAAQSLWHKFGRRAPQGVFMGQLNPGSPDKYYKSLASNLRGRTLQLFPKLPVANVEEQAPEAQTLFCLAGKEGIFAGMISPRQANGLYPGGSKFVNKGSPDTLSRAGAKIAEALHYLLMHRPPLAKGSHWLELGACPGGMTSELLAREQRVTAIDRAPLDPRLDNRPGLKFIRADVANFTPRKEAVYDALLSDMNGPPEESMAQIVRLAPALKPGGLVVFTLKVPKVSSLAEPCAVCRQIVQVATAAGLRLIAQTHLTYNRHEFTLFLERASA